MKSLSRQWRRAVAAETVGILQRRTYMVDGAQVSIADDLPRAIAGTRLWTPHQLEVALDGLPSASRGTTLIEVTNESSLAATQRLGDPVGCLNFASANKPGGGFLSGAEAQEESLARSSGLYACLREMTPFYRCHAAQRSPLYSHHAIFSPQVPVFRDDRGRLLAAPYNVSFVTAAAPNAGVLRRGDPRLDQVPSVLFVRAAKVLALFWACGVRRLVLGAWGCEHVVFAVLDHAPGAPTYRAFAGALS